jgi:hypothetical protein
VVPPGPGELVISEVLPDPEGTDGTQEWFELYVTRDVDLNGLQIGTTVGTVKETVTSASCLRATAGSYVLLAQSADPAANGGLPAPFATFSTTLLNGSGGLFVGYLGTVIDAITYPRTTAGASLSLDPGKLDASADDDPAAFCAGATAYGAGGKGTPGAANPSCALAPEAGPCEGVAGPRATVPPVAGDLVISEVMADPRGADTDQEWFELHVARDVDLNGLQIGTTAGTVKETLTSTTCLHAAAGSYVLLAHSTDPAVNGGLPAPLARFTTALVNTASVSAPARLFVGLGGAELDAMTYTRVTTGASLALDPGKLDPTANDDPGAYCAGASTYGAGGAGTPAAPNPPCP